MSVTYRRMTLADAEAVHAIEVETFPEPWSLQSFQEEMTRNACARYLVAQTPTGRGSFWTRGTSPTWR